MEKVIETEHISKEEKTLLGRCRAEIEKIDPSAEVILYGSRARGEAEPDSDYDLLVLTDGQVSLKSEDVLRRQLFPIEIETGSVITVFLVKRKDWNSALYASMPFHKNVENDGIVL